MNAMALPLALLLLVTMSVSCALGTLLVSDNRVEHNRTNPCPLGFYPELSNISSSTHKSEEDKKNCVCGKWPGNIVKCLSNGTVLLLSGYCLTYDEISDSDVLSSCPYTHYLREHSIHDPFHFVLNSSLCDLMNRKGLLCSSCYEGYGIPVQMGDWVCLRCNTSHTGTWFEYVICKTTLTSVFFFIIITLGFSATYGHMIGFIVFAHVYDGLGDHALPSYEQSLISETGLKNPVSSTFTKIVYFLYNIWNLGFIDSFHPYDCLGQNIGELQMISVGFLPALLPLGLVSIVYIGIVLHSLDFPPVVYCWKPFNITFLKIRRLFQPRASVISTFATFLLLGYNRIIQLSMKLLKPSPLSNMYGEDIRIVAHYEASLGYFKGKHIVFGITALIFLALTTVLVLFLLCFQCKPIRNCRIVSKCNSLHILADVFQGCYKDGTGGTRDYRWVAGGYLLFRIFVAALNSSVGRSFYCYMMALTCSALSLLIALLQPYKMFIFTVVDCLMFALLALLHSLMVMQLLFFTLKGEVNYLLMVGYEVLPTLPLLYLLAYAMYWIFFKKLTLWKKYLYLCQCKMFRVGVNTSNYDLIDSRVVD